MNETHPSSTHSTSTLPIRGHLFGIRGLGLRVALAAESAVFLGSSMLNLGLRVPIGSAVLEFQPPIAAAGTGELVIGLALLLAVRTGRVVLARIAVALAFAGIAFGLASSKVQGLARDAHVILVPLALVALVLLVWGWLDDRRRPRDGGSGSRRARSVRRETSLGAPGAAVIVAGLLAVAAVSYAVASAIHFGLVVPLGPVTVDDPFAGAAVPELVIAIALGAAAAMVAFGAANRWNAAFWAVAFAATLTLYGLTVTASSGRTGDVVYHVSVLVLLAVTGATIVLPPVHRSLAGPEESVAT